MAAAAGIDGGSGLRGMFGRHGERQRGAILEFLPFIRRQLGEPGVIAQAERTIVRNAIELALSEGVEPCWGVNKVYRNRRNVENAILNMYLPGIIASMTQG